MKNEFYATSCVKLFHHKKGFTMLKIKKLTLEDLEKSGEILGEVGDSLAGKAEVSIKDIATLITKRKLLLGSMK
jgi:hypothetical protein